MIVRVRGNNYSYLIEGAAIRVANRSTNKNSHTGIISILPKVQLLIGSRYEVFMQALNLSRLPIAMQKTVSKGEYDVIAVVRLSTGNIPEAKLGYIHTYRGLVVAYTYEPAAVTNKEFRRFVPLAAAHQLRIPAGTGSSGLAKAVSYVSAVTKIQRDKLIVSETAKTLKVKMKSTIWDVPIYYTFVLSSKDEYRMSQISFELNEIIQKLEKVAPEEDARIAAARARDLTENQEEV